MAEDAPDASQHAPTPSFQQQVAAASVAVAATPVAAAVDAANVTTAPRGPFRGKCLYKTGKCANERALKTSGAAHNLCDEHRRRQNEHQRKLDSKNRFSRKTKPGVSGDASGGDDASAPASPSIKTGGSSARYAPYEKSGSSGKSSRAARRDDFVEAAAPTAMALPPQSAAMKGPEPEAPQIAPVMMQAAGSMHALPMAPLAPHVPVAAPVSAAPQPPHMTYPYMMQDFDGIVVPLPSYLEGHERIEFRARIYQKVLDFISEECIRRFSGKMISEGLAAAAAQGQQQQQQHLQHQQQAPAGYFSPQPPHYHSVAAPSPPQPPQQQHAGTPNKSAISSMPDKEKRSSRASKPVEQAMAFDPSQSDESQDDYDEEPPPPAKKHARNGGGRSTRERVSKQSSATRSDV